MFCCLVEVPPSVGLTWHLAECPSATDSLVRSLIATHLIGRRGAFAVAAV